MAATGNHTDPKGRFSNRVDDYIRFRPKYPPEIYSYIQSVTGLSHASTVADIGSGTGFLAELFLRNGITVYGVEPNAAMRQAGEQYLQMYDNFISITGTAESTTLAKRSVDFITAAQAFHWFDPELTRKEFNRILKLKGWVALIWNDRRTESTPFLRAYERLLRTYGTDYAQVDHKKVDDSAIAEFFGHKQFHRTCFDNKQVLDYDGLKGRLLSSSYVPAKGQPNHEEMLAALRNLFAEFQSGKTVTIEYDTNIYLGQLD